MPVDADASKLSVLDDLTDVTPAGSNARLGEQSDEAVPTVPCGMTSSTPMT